MTKILHSLKVATLILIILGSYSWLEPQIKDVNNLLGFYIFMCMLALGTLKEVMIFIGFFVYKEYE